MVVRRAVYASIGGIVAYIGGYIYITFGTMFGDPSWFSSQLTGPVEIPHVGGWLFYDAHFVGISIEGGRFFTETVSILSLDPPWIPEFMYYAVPIATLLTAGFVVVYMVRTQDETPIKAAISGSMVAIGYVIPTVVVAAMLDVSYTDPWIGLESTIVLDMGEAILYMGLAYPVVFGGVGGLLAYLVIEASGDG